MMLSSCPGSPQCWPRCGKVVCHPGIQKPSPSAFPEQPRVSVFSESRFCCLPWDVLTLLRSRASISCPPQQPQDRAQVGCPLLWCVHKGGIVLTSQEVTCNEMGTIRGYRSPSLGRRKHLSLKHAGRKCSREALAGVREE